MLNGLNFNFVGTTLTSSVQVHRHSMSSEQTHETDINANTEVMVDSALPSDGVEMKSDAEDNDAKRQDDQLPQLGNDERETQCGIRCWRPSCLRPLGNMWCFTAALCVMNIFSATNFTYYSAVVTQIERRFGLSSQTTGFVKNIDNIGFMLTVLVVSHLGRYGNKPRILGLSCLLSGLAIFVFAIPHFIYGGPGASRQASWTSWNVSSTVERRLGGQYEVCDGVDESLADPTGCSSRNTLLEFNKGAMALFVISELLQGMVNSPKATLSLTYVDDNAKERSPIFFGT